MSTIINDATLVVGWGGGGGEGKSDHIFFQKEHYNVFQEKKYATKIPKIWFKIRKFIKKLARKNMKPSSRFS